jgi:hypothetical protein
MKLERLRRHLRRYVGRHLATASKSWRLLVAMPLGYSYFICYAKEDRKYARALRRDLGKRRLIAFLDEKNLFGVAKKKGEEGFRSLVDRAIRHSGALLVIETPAGRNRLVRPERATAARAMFQSQMAGFAGRWREWRDLTRRAIEIADQVGQRAAGTRLASADAPTAAALGDCATARSLAARAVTSS